MATRQTTSSLTVAAVFTSLVAPVLVNIIVERTKPDALPAKTIPDAARTTSPPPATLITPQPAPRPADTTQVVVQGTGRTPQEALNVALRSALQWALAGEIDHSTAARIGPTGLGILAHDQSLIVGWKELHAAKDWKLTGSIYRKDVAVQVDRNALRDRLRTGGAAAKSQP